MGCLRLLFRRGDVLLELPTEMSIAFFPNLIETRQSPDEQERF
jgi:hypothetical protein